MTKRAKARSMIATAELLTDRSSYISVGQKLFLWEDVKEKQRRFGRYVSGPIGTRVGTMPMVYDKDADPVGEIIEIDGENWVGFYSGWIRKIILKRANPVPRIRKVSKRAFRAPKGANYAV